MLSTSPESREFDLDQIEKAKNAIDHIGVASIPFLVKWVQNSDSPRWRDTLVPLVYRISPRLCERLMHPRSRRLAEGTYESFRVLGKRALPAREDLVRLMDDAGHHDPLTTIQVTMDLSCFGTNALPALLAAGTNAEHLAWPQALDAICMISDLGDAAQSTVIAITNLLSDPIREETAVFTLGNLRAVPQISLPAIASRLQSTNAHLRGNCVTALGNFGPQAVSYFPALTNALRDADPYVRYCAAEALRNIAATKLTNAPPGVKAGGSPGTEARPAPGL
jgi:hypothetical protein